MKKNKSKTVPALLLLVLMPILIPLYAIGALAALIHVTVFCGYKNTEAYFMDGLGFETNEQIMRRIIAENEKGTV